MEVEINYLAVALAALSSMAVGFVWYAPKVFGNAWAKLARVDLNRKMSTGEMVYTFGGTFVASLVTAYVLAHVTFMSNQVIENTFLVSALTTAFWLWLGFTAARIFTHDAFENRRKKLTLLAFGYELITVVVMALIIGSMGV